MLNLIRTFGRHKEFCLNITKFPIINYDSTKKKICFYNNKGNVVSSFVYDTDENGKAEYEDIQKTLNSYLNIPNMNTK